MMDEQASLVIISIYCVGKLIDNIDRQTSSFGITILRSPIAMDSFVSEACANSAEGGSHLCNKLVSLNDL